METLTVLFTKDKGIQLVHVVIQFIHTLEYTDSLFSKEGGRGD